MAIQPQASCSEGTLSKVTTKEPVFIITPVHNRRVTTLACLEHLKMHGDLQRYHVVIVDDGSTDGTAEAIHAEYSEVTVLPGDGNLWWTGAMAKGMEFAYEQGGKYFFWLNDDCLPEAGTLQQLVEFMKMHPNTIVAPTCYFIQDNVLIRHHNGSKGRQGHTAYPGEIVQVDGMSGWCVGIPISVFAKIGSPDAGRFPHYSGDDAYIFRATRNGFKACLIGDLTAQLVGGVHERLGFQHYFRSGLTPIATFQALFWNKKSPYRIPTKFFHCIERYGVLLGTCAFMTKLLAWLGQWAKLQFTSWVNPQALVNIQTDVPHG